MDPNNQNLDGIKPGENQAPSSGMDGFVVPQKSQNLNGEAEPEINQEPQQPAKQADPIKPKSGKGIKILLVLFIMLFAATAALAAMLYMQNKQTKDDLKAAQQNITKLQTAANNTNKEKVDQLTEENATLQKTINQQNTYIDALTKAAQALKTKCGTACSSIAIPPNPLATTPTPTPTGSPAPSATPTPTPAR